MTAGGPEAPARPDTERAVVLALAGAVTIAFSAILVRLADVAPPTSAAYRCLYALPALGLLAWREGRGRGAVDRGDRRFAVLAGAFFGADLIFWHQAIADVGAGLATVLGNLQVVVVPAAAWVLLKEPPGSRILAALPLTMTGIVLISGVLEDDAYGARPLHGVIFGILTALTYAGFILALRRGNRGLRRPAGALFEATAVAAAFAFAAAVMLGVDDLAPAWPSAAWLVILALGSQVFGWLLISTSLPRLPAALTSVILTVQPVGSVLLGVLLLGERPTVLQMAGAACIISALLAVAARRRTPVS